MPVVAVGRAVAADAERLATVYRSAYAQNEALGFPAKAGSATAETVREWIEDDCLYAATVDPGEDGGGETGGAGDSHRLIVGGVRLQQTDPDRMQLSRLGVHADWKGRGIGGRLLDHAEAVARDRDCGTIWLTTPPEHPFLLDLYRGRGYERTGAWPLEYRDYDEVVMEKRLEG